MCKFLNPTDDYLHCCRMGNIVTVFLKSLACPVSKCILILLCSVDTVNLEGFFFVCTFGAQFFYSRLRFLFFCVHLVHTFLQTVCLVLLSTLDLRRCFTGREWVKSVKFKFRLWIWNNALSQTYALFVPGGHLEFQ
jgi:hypothetical protein